MVDSGWRAVVPVPGVFSYAFWTAPVNAARRRTRSRAAGQGASALRADFARFARGIIGAAKTPSYNEKLNAAAP